MVKCVFCGKEDIPIRGVHFITNTGEVQFLCSSKCRKSALKLRRDKRRLKWTEAYRIASAKARETKARATQVSPVAPESKSKKAKN